MDVSREVDDAREIVIAREFDAPRERVFEAWTDHKQVGRWWGPRGFTTTTHESDVRSGGVWRFVMHGPDGVDYKNVVRYVEVVKPERVVYEQAGEEEHDHIRFRTTVTFDDVAGKTRLTLRLLFATPEERDRVVRENGAIEGGNQTLERLAEHLSQVAA